MISLKLWSWSAFTGLGLLSWYSEVTKRVDLFLLLVVTAFNACAELGQGIAGIACWIECQTHYQKVASPKPSRSSGRIFFSRDSFVCWLFFGVGSTPVLPQWHMKDPGHSTKSAGGRLHLNAHRPLTQRSWSGLTMPLSRHSVGIYEEKSSHATR